MRSATQSNGKFSGQTDNISAEQVVYAYDALNRLASAAATSGTWGQSYGYYGFGNLQNQTVTAGTAPALSVTYNASNNRQSTDCADAIGNIYGNTVSGWNPGQTDHSPIFTDSFAFLPPALREPQVGPAAPDRRWRGPRACGSTPRAQRRCAAH